MKKILLIIILAVCGCKPAKTFEQQIKEANPELPEDIRVSPNLFKTTVDGHDYIHGYRRGIVHAESCSSVIHLAK